MRYYGIIILICIIMCTACDEVGETSNYNVNENGDMNIVIIGKGDTHRFWELIEEGALRAADSYSVSLDYKNTNKDTDIEEQLNILDEAIEKGAKVICIAPLDDTQCEKYYIRAKEKGIPIIVFDSEINTDTTTVSIAIDNYEAASIVADKLAEEVGQGEVAIINHSKTNNTGTYRQDGFKYKMLEEHEGISVIDIQYSDGDSEKAEVITNELLLLYPDLKGIFGTNEATMKGILNAIKGTKRFDIKLAGFDSGQSQIEAVEDETLIGFISQNPINMGYKLVETAVKIARGEKIETDISMEYLWIDQSNMYNEDAQPFVYE